MLRTLLLHMRFRFHHHYCRTHAPPFRVPPHAFCSENRQLNPMLRTLLVHMHSRFHHLYRTVHSPFTSHLVNWPLLSRRKVGEKKQT